MKPIQLFPLNTDAIAELDELYRTTRDVRVRTRAQMILLAGEQPRLPHEIAAIVRKDEQTVRRWLKRYWPRASMDCTMPRAVGPPVKSQWLIKSN